MFGDKATVSMMTIHDDRAGEGLNLAFPNMSTCAAIICVLDDRLVGVHKTMGSISGKQLQLFDYAKTLIDGDTVHKVIIAGWNATTASDSKHPPVEIRNALGCPDAATYIFNYATTTLTSKNTHSGKKITQPAFKTHMTGSKMKDLCTFAARNGTDFPHISAKRTTKVGNAMDGKTLYADGMGSDLAKFGSVAEDVTSSHDHLINQNKFTQVG